jgi:hypothetical protein
LTDSEFFVFGGLFYDSQDFGCFGDGDISNFY